MKSRYNHQIVKLFTIILFILIFGPNLVAQDPLSPQELLQLKSCSDSKISQDGKWIAYSVRVPRDATDKPGSAYNELYLMSNQDKSIIPTMETRWNTNII